MRNFKGLLKIAGLEEKAVRGAGLPYSIFNKQAMPAGAWGQPGSLYDTEYPPPQPVQPPQPIQPPQPVPQQPVPPQQSRVTRPVRTVRSARPARPDRNQMFDNLTPEQRRAFTTWAQQDGRGKAMGAVFTKQNLERFIQDNPQFLTGTDQQRNEILKKHISNLSLSERERIRRDPRVVDYLRSQGYRRTQQNNERIRQNNDRRYNDTVNAINQRYKALDDGRVTAKKLGLPPNTIKYNPKDVPQQAWNDIGAGGRITWQDPRTGRTYSATADELRAAGGMARFMGRTNM
jgi:hypothetical protein